MPKNSNHSKDESIKKSLEKAEEVIQKLKDADLDSIVVNHKESKEHQSDENSEIEKLKFENKLLQDEISNLSKIIGNFKESQNKLEHKLKEDEHKLKAIALGLQEKANVKTKEVIEENHQKLAKEITHVHKYGAKNLLNALADPLNNLEMAIEFGSSSENHEVKNYVSGFKMIMIQIETALESENIFKIKPKIGDEYDHTLHEAISTEENKHMKNKIVKVQKNGFKLHERIIKPALVVIGK